MQFSPLGSRHFCLFILFSNYGFHYISSICRLISGWNVSVCQWSNLLCLGFILGLLTSGKALQGLGLLLFTDLGLTDCFQRGLSSPWRMSLLWEVSIYFWPCGICLRLSFILSGSLSSSSYCAGRALCWLPQTLCPKRYSLWELDNLSNDLDKGSQSLSSVLLFKDKDCVFQT